MNQKHQRIFFVALSLLAWGYLWIRAIFVPLVHDEIATFHNYIQIGRFLPYFSHWDANNHILNSAVSALFYRIFGLSPLVIRLANLISFPLFCLYLWKSGSFFSHPVVRWALFSSLLLSHGFTEFFSLSRGYGISMALLMPSLYYLIRMTQTYSRRKMISAILFGALATLANLSLFNTFLLLILYLLLFVLFSGKVSTGKQRIMDTGWILVAGMPFFILFTMISFEFRAKGLLYTGGGNGLWRDTVETLLGRLFNTTNLAVLIIVVLFFILTVTVALIRLVRERTIFSPSLVYVTFLLGYLAGAMLLHHLLKVNYPENRVALFLFPLFIGSVCFATEDLTALAKSSKALIILIPFLLIPLHFFSHINLTHASFYAEDLIPERFFQRVKQSDRQNGYPPIVSGKRLTHFCWSFYDFCEEGTESQISFTHFPEKISDFQIADSSDLTGFAVDYRVIDSTMVNHRYLLERRVPARRILAGEETGIRTNGLTDSEYVRLFFDTVQTLRGHSAYIGITAEIFSPVEPFHTWIVAEVKDTANQTVQYERISLYWFRSAWNEDTKQFKNGIFLSQVPAEATVLKLYIWNIEKVPFRVGNGKVDLFILTDSTESSP